MEKGISSPLEEIVRQEKMNRDVGIIQALGQFAETLGGREVVIYGYAAEALLHRHDPEAGMGRYHGDTDLELVLPPDVSYEALVPQVSAVVDDISGRTWSAHPVDYHTVLFTAPSAAEEGELLGVNSHHLDIHLRHAVSPITPDDTEITLRSSITGKEHKLPLTKGILPGENGQTVTVWVPQPTDVVAGKITYILEIQEAPIRPKDIEDLRSLAAMGDFKPDDCIRQIAQWIEDQDGIEPENAAREAQAYLNKFTSTT